MADTTLPGGAQPCKAAASAFFDGACTLEMIELDAERLSETAYALATSEAFDSNAQAAFYCLGQLGERLYRKAKSEGDRLTQLSGKGGR